MTNSPQANLGTAPKLWRDRDFDECCYPVSGVGPETMVCAEPCSGSYCPKHRRELDARLIVKRPKRAQRPKLVRKTNPLCGKPRKPLPEQTMRRVLDSVCRDWSVSPDVVLSQSRDPQVTFARQMLMWQLRQLDYSFPSIGAAVGRDQSSAQHGVRRINEWLEEGASSIPAKRPGDVGRQEGLAETLT